MKALEIPFEECRYYDYTLALEAYKKMGCKGKPMLGVITFKSDTEEWPTIGWCSEEKEGRKTVYQPLPIFKSFRDKDEYHTILFTKIGADQVFETDGRLFMTIQTENGPGIRRIDMLFDEGIVITACYMRGFPPLEYILCKVKTIEDTPQFVGYFWVGYGEDPIKQAPLTIFVPLFAEDSGIINEYNPLELDRVAVNIGEYIKRDNTIFQVINHPQNGVTAKALFAMQSNYAN